MGMPAAVNISLDEAGLLGPGSGVNRLRLAARLYASLDVREVLHGFVQALAHQSAVTGLDYEAPDRLALRAGRKAPHRFSCKLHHGSMSLGTLALFSDFPFTAATVQQLRLLLSESLAGPLANALRYRAAATGAVHDDLTGCAGAAALLLCTRREVARARRHGGPATLVAVDVDHLRTINDFYGWAAGERVLVRVGRVLEQCSRDSDVAFRLQGGAFVVLLANADLAAGLRVAERIRQALRESPVEFGDEEIRVTVSSGVAALDPTERPECWIERAQMALHQAKESGRDAVAVAEAEQQAA